MIKSYKLNINPNEVKIDGLTEILQEYRKIAKIISNKQFYYFFKEANLSKSNSLYKGIESKMTERWKDICKR